MFLTQESKTILNVGVDVGDVKLLPGLKYAISTYIFNLMLNTTTLFKFRVMHSI